MFSDLSTSSVAALIPQVAFTVPYIGVVNMTPYLLAAGLFIGLSLFFKLIQVIVVARLKALSKKTNTDIDDVFVAAIDGIRAWVYTLVALYVAVQFFLLPEWIDIILTAIFLFSVVWQGIEIITKFIDYGAQRFLEKDEGVDGVIDPGSATASSMVTLLSRIVLWAVGGLFVLSNLGIEVTSLIAGLGIGGVAVAFALQGILSDLFASFSLYFDRPFRIGDFIIVGSDAGTVEKIGIKTTRIRTLQGEELVVSNAELTTARVQNFKKMSERRISSQFGITYETEQKLVREVPGIVERIFEDIDGVRLDRVHFTSFGDSALIYEMVYFVNSSDYKIFMDIQQKFNFRLIERFAELGIDFAYPTQTVYHKEIS